MLIGGFITRYNRRVLEYESSYFSCLNRKRHVLEADDEDDHFERHGAFVDAVVDDTNRFERGAAGANDALLAGDLVDREFPGNQVAKERDGMLVPAGLLAGGHLDEKGGHFGRAFAGIGDGLAGGVGGGLQQGLDCFGVHNGEVYSSSGGWGSPNGIG